MGMIRSFMSPPYKVLHVLEVVAYLLEEPQTNINWNGFRRMISNVQFMEKLVTFDPCKMSPATRAKVRNFMETNHMDTPQYK